MAPVSFYLEQLPFSNGLHVCNPRAFELRDQSKTPAVHAPGYVTPPTTRGWTLRCLAPRGRGGSSRGRISRAAGSGAWCAARCRAAAQSTCDSERHVRESAQRSLLQQLNEAWVRARRARCPGSAAPRKALRLQKLQRVAPVRLVVGDPGAHAACVAGAQPAKRRAHLPPARRM